MQAINCVRFLRACYQADSQDLSLLNIGKIPKSEKYLDFQVDYLSSGQHQRVPVVGETAANLHILADKYVKERQLLYGVMMVEGKTSSDSQTSKLSAPLLYFPATINQDDDLYLSIDASDIQFNKRLIRAVLRPDCEDDALARLPDLVWPLDANTIAVLSRWLAEHTQLTALENIGAWPNLEEYKPSRKTSLRLLNSACLLLFRRGRGSRDVLYDLDQITGQGELSAPMTALLANQQSVVTSQASESDLVPGLLSSEQNRALRNATQQTLSLISGPPGTGKSYTIAALAIDRLLHGESVLLCAKTDQAVSVLCEKLERDFSFKHSLVFRAGHTQQQAIKPLLEAMLAGQITSPPRLQEQKKQLVTGHKQLKRLESRLQRYLEAYQTPSSASWWVKLKSKITLFKVSGELLWQLQENIASLSDELDLHKRDYLQNNRLAALSDSVEQKRQTFVVFDKMIRSRTAKRQAELFAELDLRQILRAFPVWVLKTSDIGRLVPAQKELFDCVIFDEASQCDLATAMGPLFRAKRGVFVGDRNQLRHVSFLSKAQQNRLAKTSDVASVENGGLNYRDESLMDVAFAAIHSVDAITNLIEHFRGRPELISFSNQQFYDGRLRIMKARPMLSESPVLSFHRINGERSATGINLAEAQAIAQRLQELVSQDQILGQKSPCTIGVLSPFRDQAQYLRNLIDQNFPASVVIRHDIRVDTPYGFQGEERDIMLLSFVLDDQAKHSAAYLNKRDVFNVAVTRAKQLQEVYYSISPQALKRDSLLRQYLQPSLAAQNSPKRRADCDIAQAIERALGNQGVEVWRDFFLLGENIDLLCHYQNRWLAVDLVGGHSPVGGAFDALTYKRLLRTGIPVAALPVASWLSAPEQFLNLLLARLQQR